MDAPLEEVIREQARQVDELTQGFRRLEQQFLAMSRLLTALTDAFVEVEDHGDDPTFSLDGPVDNAERDQSKPL